MDGSSPTISKSSSVRLEMVGLDPSKAKAPKRYCQRLKYGGVSHHLESRSQFGGVVQVGLRLIASSPLIRIWPLVGSTNRLIILSEVVLPQPDGPTKATSSPAGISSDKLSTAGDDWPRYFFVIFLNSMLAPAVLVLVELALAGVLKSEAARALGVSDIFL